MKEPESHKVRCLFWIGHECNCDVSPDKCPGCGAEHGVVHARIANGGWDARAAYLCGTLKGQAPSPECLMRQRDQLRAENERLKHELGRLNKENAGEGWRCPQCGSEEDPYFSRMEPMGYFCGDCGKEVGK